MIDDLLAECSSLGYILSYCYQSEDGSHWRVVLHKPVEDGRLCQMVEAPSFALALESCMSRMADAELAIDPAIAWSVDNKPDYKISLLELISGPKVEVRRI